MVHPLCLSHTTHTTAWFRQEVYVAQIPRRQRVDWPPCLLAELAGWHSLSVCLCLPPLHPTPSPHPFRSSPSIPSVLYYTP